MTAINAAATQPARTPARVRLRPTMTSDIEFVLSLEQDPLNLPFITPWEKTQHEAAVRFPDFRHFIIEGGDNYDAVGFLILIGCKSRNRSLELKRMVVRSKGEGFGRAALREVKKIAFDDLHAHRLWLDVKTVNQRAKALYDSEGFVVEGVLREAVLTDEGFASLVVMSMLAPEFARRREQALEVA
ncbi:GNAT family N-acetyltransferase [Ramlibacter albus]|uniref:GNAT family N-acetyltransferase n=1 Tax=Ramlibacter albus TaxID=2079448 RepID=A0A923M9X2_9BURK|nr:GNAT family protein [Ramlibacter albus]MBC5766351.1 GNAT family N-acetyltransferase [Ramlibacter albus]